MRHLSWPAFFRGNHAIDRARSKNIARQREKLVRIYMIILSERPQVPLLDHVLLGCFNVDPFRIVNRCGVIADPDDFDAALVGQRQSCDRTDVAESLHDRGAFFRIHLQHVHRALDEINDAATSSFTPAFGPADGDRFAGDDFIHGVAHVNGVGVHEPRHDLFVGAHVRAHDVGVRTDERNHFLHVTARHGLEFRPR